MNPLVSTVLLWERRLEPTPRHTPGAPRDEHLPEHARAWIRLLGFSPAPHPVPRSEPLRRGS